MCYLKKSFPFNSAGEVSLNEQAGHGAAAKVLWQLGSRGMTVSDLIFCIGGSRGGREGRTPPLGVQILSISCSFRENLACSRPPWRVHAPPLEGSRPPSGKSWIRHCSVSKN